MEQPAPQRITGTLYGSAQLEVFESDGSLHVSCPAWLRLQLNRLQWEIAVPHEALAFSSNRFQGCLKSLELRTEDGAHSFRTEDIEFSEVRLHNSSFWGNSPLSDWQPQHDEPFDFPANYELLSVQAKHSCFQAEQQENLGIYACWYQLPPVHHRINHSIALPNGSQLYICLFPATGCTWATLYAEHDWSDFEEYVALALELWAGGPSQQTQRQRNSTRDVMLTNSSLPTPWPSVTVSDHPMRVLEHIVGCFASMSSEYFGRLHISSRQHLFGKCCDAPTETRYIMAMTWVEMLDGVDTMRFSITANLLGLDVASTEFLQEVRNKLVHQAGSFPEAIQLALKKIFDPKERRKSSPPLRSPHSAHETLILEELGIPVPFAHPEFPVRLTLRLIERIDTSIWQFLNISPALLRRSAPLTRWLQAVPQTPTAIPAFDPATRFPRLEHPHIGVKKAAEAAS